MPVNRGWGGREIGYLIPQEDGSGTVCYQVTVPDTPEWRLAFRDVVSILRQGRFWKREEGKRRIDNVQMVGRQIYDSIELCGSSGQDDDCNQTETEIIKIIRERKKCIMCFCCDNDNSQILEGISSNTDTIQPETPDTLPPADLATPIDSGFNDWKCRASQHILNLWYKAVLDARNWIEIADGETSGMIEQITLVFDLIDGGEVYSRLWQVWSHFALEMLHSLTNTQVTAIRSFINDNRIQLTEILYCTSTAPEAKQGFIDYVEATSLGRLTKWIIRLWIDVLPFEALYQTAAQRMNATDYALIQSSYASGCTCGVVSPSMPALPASNYVFVPMLLDSMTFQNGMSGGATSNIYEFTGGNDAVANVTVLEPEYDSVVVPQNERAGFAIQLLSEDIENTQTIGFGHRLGNASTQVSEVAFGAVNNNEWDVNKWFVGSSGLPEHSDLTAWLASDPDFQQNDPASDTDDGKLVFSFQFYNDVAGTGDNNSVVQMWWIIDTTDL